MIDKIIFKEYDEYNEEEILNLYKAVGWSNYFNKPQMLENAYKHSLYVVGAYVEDQLVGIVRVVGDGASIIYIQDIVVLPDHQRQGIGRGLFEKVVEKYSEVYQKVLITDNTEKTKAFYEELGFSAIETMDGKCFVQYTV